jgi:hypothetical protein
VSKRPRGSGFRSSELSAALVVLGAQSTFLMRLEAERCTSGPVGISESEARPSVAAAAPAGQEFLIRHICSSTNEN